MQLYSHTTMKPLKLGNKLRKLVKLKKSDTKGKTLMAS